HLLVQLARRECTDVHEDLAKPAYVTALRLHGARKCHISLSHLAGAHKHAAQRVGIAVDACVNVVPFLEPDLALVVPELRANSERPALATEVEELEYVMDSEIAERSLDCHYAASVTSEADPERRLVRPWRSSDLRARAAAAPVGSSEIASYQQSRASGCRPSTARASPAADSVIAYSGSRT